MSAVPRAVPSAVAPATGGNNVAILTGPQLGPYKPPTGSSVNPVVPRTEGEGEPRAQPHWISPPGNASSPGYGNEGAPSVPVNGFLFRQGPIDAHYTSPVEVGDPYKKVNNPPTRGLFTWVKDYVNGIAKSQDKDTAGWNVRYPQQRVSHMRITPPAHGAGYSPETFTPRQLPQRTAVAKFMPSTGTQAYGTGVLNSDTFGAGQTAGGIGGNQYTPAPGPPPTTSTAGGQDNPAGMPVWG